MPGSFADPNLIVLDGRFYLYPTTDGHENWSSSSFRAFSSSDLVDWTDHGVVLELGRDVRWATGHAWAPGMAERNGQYYFYFTADQSIGVAVGATPVGPFVDLGRPLVAKGDFPGAMIDPSVFIDSDGTAYLYWGNTFAYAVPLGEDMMSFDPAAVQSWQPRGFREAAWVHRRDCTYYLTWSENDTRDANYRVRYATGESPLGPWVDGDIILEKDHQRGILGTGHHSIIQIPHTDEWVIAYHRFTIPDGHGYRRETMFDVLHHGPSGLLQKVVHSRTPVRSSLHHQPNTKQ